MEVNIHEAKTHLSRLLEQALAGEDVVIAKSGRPLARLVRVQGPLPVLGDARGQVVFKPGWDDPLTDQEIIDLFGK
ncbi:MAG: type II toxin-antitoxin system prevent-host-death family antitoxin [Bryobacteraceae bacterium]|nr:type II toxin-antitoxin system prevent-host-death family antitoxin [Bryobacteraceae bacterium]